MKIIITTNLPEEKTWIVPVTTIDYLDSLEEALYVLWELNPSHRMWKADLVRTGVTSFEYGEDIAIVRWIGDLTYKVEM